MSSANALLPHDELSERSLIGCLLVDGQSYDNILDLSLSGKDFYNPRYGIVFEAISDLVLESRPVDYVTVAAALSDRQKLEAIGGEQGLISLVEEQISAANIWHYAKTVKDKSLVRRVIRLSQKIAEDGRSFDGDTQEYVSGVERELFALTSQTRQGGLEGLKTYLKINLKELESGERGEGEVFGIPTGFKDLDGKLLGMQPGQLIIVAARPAMGKTSFVLNVAVQVCRAVNLPVAIFSLEMMASELSTRILSSEAQINSRKMRIKNFSEGELKRIAHTVNELSDLPLYINDSASVTLLDIRSQCRKIKSESGLGLIVIDYLQLMQSIRAGQLSREQQISEISRGLKNLAKELDCPIIALSQLNRSLESRPDKRPLLSDLRESGSIEQDADIVLMLYRDEVYNPETEAKGMAEAIIGKNRSGETGKIDLTWIADQTRFGDYAFQQMYDA